MTEKTAITSAAFDAALKKTGMADACPKIAVAVSGGGDSLALTLLLQEWLAARRGTLLALTVDHKLRPGSSEEAAEVHALLQARGITHEILSWQGDKPATHVQELAREARYKLLLDTCRQRGFPFLAVAHNLEDQIETFWMRLAHGSGLDGLAAMSALSSLRTADDVTLLRPLLGFSRARLRATCARFNISWIDDPSNSNERFLRVKLRRFEDLLAEEGLTPARLAQTVQKLGDAREALQVMAAEAFAACVEMHTEGYASLKMPAWLKAPREIQRRVLMQALMILSPRPYPPGFEAVEEMRLELNKPAFAGKTLGGCEIFPAAGGTILLAREEHTVAGRTRLENGGIWDGRFTTINFPPESVDIGALGEGGLSELRKNAGLSKKLESLPHKVKRTLPALWRGGNLLAVPHLSHYSPESSPALRSGQIIFAGVKIV